MTFDELYGDGGGGDCSREGLAGSCESWEFNLGLRCFTRAELSVTMMANRFGSTVAVSPRLTAGASAPALKRAHLRRLMAFVVSVTVCTFMSWEGLISSWTLRVNPGRIFRDFPSLIVSLNALFFDEVLIGPACNSVADSSIEIISTCCPQI